MTTVHSASSMRSASASAREAAEDDGVGCADAGARQHGDRELRDHRHVDGDSVALLHAKPAQRVREAADLVEQLGVRDGARVAGLTFPVVRHAVAQSRGHMAVEAVGADVELAADEPLRIRRLPRVELVPRLHPVEPVALLRPEGAEALLRGGALVDRRVVQQRRGAKLGRGLEGAVLAQEVLDRLAGIALLNRHPPILVRPGRPARRARKLSLGGTKRPTSTSSGRLDGRHDRWRAIPGHSGEEIRSRMAIRSAAVQRSAGAERSDANPAGLGIDEL